MIVMKTYDDVKEDVKVREFKLQITREQEHAIMEEARRWEIEDDKMLQFILCWGFEMYFRR